MDFEKIFRNGKRKEVYMYTDRWLKEHQHFLLSSACLESILYNQVSKYSKIDGYDEGIFVQSV